MTRRDATRRGLALAALLAAMLPACYGQPARPAADVVLGTPIAEVVAADSAFAGLVAALSEAGGYFDTDNLISNEASYQHVLGALRERGVAGGAYLGVGPGQNFTYIAHVRPEIAFVVDIRRDNLLQHLFYKAIFADAPTRLDFLALLLGRPAPTSGEADPEAPLSALLAYIDRTPAHAADAASAQVRDVLLGSPVPLSADDLATIERMHRAFIDEGLDLQFTSHYRAPRPYYPTLRQLLLATDLDGQPGHFLAREADYQFLRQMQTENRVVPVVGDLAGPHALPAIGALLRRHGLAVSAFYTSNVEFYLMRQGQFGRFAENLAALPHDARSVIIRSYFNRWQTNHPETVPGYASTQLLQPIARLLDDQQQGGYRSYWDLITRHALALD